MLWSRDERRAWWLAAAGLAACEREAVRQPCPELEPGGLVVTELRGPQAGADSYGEWVELHRPAGEEVDLRGLSLLLTPGDGGEMERLLVRTTLPLRTGGHAVLGAADPEALPDHLDYGLGTDLPAGLPAGGVLELLACDVLVDEIVFRALPDAGTWSFDGDKAASAEANDDESCWCTDAAEPPEEEPMTGIGLPGTPGGANRPCP